MGVPSTENLPKGGGLILEHHNTAAVNLILNYAFFFENLFINPHPLSAVKKTNVSFSTPASLRVAKICPTPQSSSLRASPKVPRMLELVNILLAN